MAVLERAEFLLKFVQLRLVLLPLSFGAYRNEPFLGQEPFVRVVSGAKQGLQLIILFLRYWFEFMVVTLGALNGHPKQRGTDELYDSLDYGITVHRSLQRIAVALTRTVRCV